MIHLFSFLIILIGILIIYIIFQNDKIKTLKKGKIDSQNEKIEDKKFEVLMWLRFPFYCCLAFVSILFILVISNINGLYKFTNLQLLFLTFSSFFFVSSDLCLAGMNIKTDGIAPKWVEYIYNRTSKNAYKRFFWIAFLCFLMSFIFQAYEPKFINEMLDSFNISYGIISLAFVIFIYGIRSLEVIAKYFNEN